MERQGANELTVYAKKISRIWSLFLLVQMLKFSSKI